MKRIILVEDNSAIRDVFVWALDPQKYQISAFGCGTSIFEEKIESPDVFIIDKNISGTDGSDLCHFIKNSEHYKNTPVILVSAIPNLKEIAAKVHADDILAKPFSLSRLREIVVKYTT